MLLILILFNQCNQSESNYFKSNFNICYITDTNICSRHTYLFKDWCNKLGTYSETNWTSKMQFFSKIVMWLGCPTTSFELNYYRGDSLIHSLLTTVFFQGLTRNSLDYVLNLLSVTNTSTTTLNMSNTVISILITQPAITCSKLTIETLEQGVKYVQS